MSKYKYMPLAILMGVKATYEELHNKLSKRLSDIEFHLDEIQIELDRRNQYRYPVAIGDMLRATQEFMETIELETTRIKIGDVLRVCELADGNIYVSKMDYYFPIRVKARVAVAMRHAYEGDSNTLPKKFDVIKVKKLPERKIQAILDDLYAGDTHNEIANRYEVSLSTVSNIKKSMY